LQNTDFVEADLSESIITGSDLQDAQFHNTKLEKADLRDSINYSIDPENNRLKSAKFSQDQISGLLAKYQIKIYK
jgi:fluoroquinolone resistance protein